MELYKNHCNTASTKIGFQYIINFNTRLLRNIRFYYLNTFKYEECFFLI